MEELLQNASKYSFLEAYKLLCESVQAQKLNPLHVVRLRPVLGLSHSRTQVVSVEKQQQNDRVLYFLNVNLPGLYGSNSPLPKFFTEELIQASHKEQDEARLFLDLIHQRLFQLVFAAKAQHLPHYLDNGKQGIHDFMLAMAGFRNQSWLANFPDRTFILRNLHLFRHQRGTAAGLKLLLTDLFRNAEVNIVQFVPRWLSIQLQQQLALNSQANQLGVNALLGDKMQETQAKLRIEISAVSAQEYNYWCINQDNWLALKELVQHFVVQPLLIDLELEVEPQGKFDLTLEHSLQQGFALGRNTWLLGGQSYDHKAYIRARKANRQVRKVNIKAHKTGIQADHNRKPAKAVLKASQGNIKAPLRLT